MSESEWPNLRHILACINEASCAQAVLTHAAAVAKAAGARMTVLHVLASPATLATKEPTDPVEWAQRHCATTAHLHELLSRLGDLHAEVVIVDGPPAERICAWAYDNFADLLVLGRGGEGDAPGDELGDTARRIIKIANASVLLVPEELPDGAPINYRKLLVPLDGSFRSECALPLGLEIAAAHGAEIILVHAAPAFDFIEGDLLNAEAILLRDQLHDHNERAARQYLSRLRSRLPTLQATGIRLVPSGDARRALARTAMEEHADLLVLSATGKGAHAEMAVGGMADYLINRLKIPVLLVRQPQQSQLQTHGETCQATDIRPPNQRPI